MNNLLPLSVFAAPENIAESCWASERGIRIGSLVPGLTAITILCVAIFGDAFKSDGCGVIICCVPLIPILSASFGLSSGSLRAFLASDALVELSGTEKKQKIFGN